MYQPQGFENQSAPDLVYKQNKPIYGFKQAPRAQFLKLSTSFLDLGFQNLKDDIVCSFFGQVYFTLDFILVYMDDIILIQSDPSYLSELISLLHTGFSLNDLCDLNFFLGIQISQYDGYIYLRQHK